jgi:hypothetical protein
MAYPFFLFGRLLFKYKMVAYIKMAFEAFQMNDKLIGHELATSRHFGLKKLP